MFVMNSTTARQTSINELSVSNYKHKQKKKQQNIQNDYFSTDSPLTGILHFLTKVNTEQWYSERFYKNTIVYLKQFLNCAKWKR